MAQTKPLKRPDILNDKNVLQREIKENTYNGNVDWDAVLNTKNRLDKYNNVKGKLNPTSSGDSLALKKRQKESARDSLSLGDTEFDMDILPEFLSPIGRLGHNAKNYNIVFKNTPTKIGGTYSSRSDVMDIQDARVNKDKNLPSKMLRSTSTNPAIEHEAIHRGLNILYDYYKDDAPSFIKLYGKDTWEFLKKANPKTGASKEFQRKGSGNLYAEVISEINDGNRAMKDGDFNFVDSYYQRFKDSASKSLINKILNKGQEVLPMLEKAAMDRLTDKNPTGGISDDAQNMPKESQTRNFSKGGGSVFRMGYSKADPETLAYYDSAKDELIYIDGGAVEKNPSDNKLTIGLRIGVYKMLGKGQAKGGDVKMDKQMQMVFMDDGMDKDPVSGNVVPTGSLAEEVRDDVPAMLSEGEYVVPADVLRFYGMKFFEDLRMNAKIALAKMEAEGRIGGEPIDSKEPMKAAGGITVDNDPIIKLVRAIMKDQPSYSYEEAMHMAKMFYDDKIKELGIVEGRNKGGVIQANTGLTVGGGNMTPEQQAAQEAAQASASVTTSAGNTGYTAPIQAPSNQAFMQAVNVGSNAAPKTAKFISSNGALIDVLVGPDGLPLYGAPAGYVKASSPEGQQLMVQFGHSQADPNVAAPDATPEAIPTPKPKKDNKSGQDAFDRADKTRKEVEAAQTKAIERLGISDRADDYKALSFAQRASLALIEGKKMFDPEYVITETERNKINEVLDNPADSPDMLDILKNPLALLTGGSGSSKADTPSTFDRDEFLKIKDYEQKLQNLRDTNQITKNELDAFKKSQKDREDRDSKIVIKNDPSTTDIDGKPVTTTVAERNEEEASNVDKYGIGNLNKGALVTKRTRKLRVKRKSLGQK